MMNRNSSIDPCPASVRMMLPLPTIMRSLPRCPFRSSSSTGEICRSIRVLFQPGSFRVLENTSFSTEFIAARSGSQSDASVGQYPAIPS